MIRPLILLASLIAVAAMVGGPAAASPTGPARTPRSAGDTTAPATLVCSWEWKKKKVVRWVRRHGKKKRVVIWKKIKVKVCHEAPVPDPSRLGVKAWEFGFTLSAKEIDAGDTIVELNNQGEDDHNLHIQSTDGGEELATPDIEPGGIDRIRLDTAPGTYRLWCSLPTHAERGMDTTFTVTDAPEPASRSVGFAG